MLRISWEKSVTNLNKKKLKLKLPALITAIFIFFLSCGGEKENPVPEIYVDITVHLTDPRFSALQSPGGWVYITGGYNGIFLYNLNGRDFYAYDRTCCLNTRHAPLVFDEKTKCLCHADTVTNCNSRYNVLLHGAVSSGDAKHALREYETVSDNFGSAVRITNSRF